MIGRISTCALQIPHFDWPAYDHPESQAHPFTAQISKHLSSSHAFLARSSSSKYRHKLRSLCRRSRTSSLWAPTTNYIAFDVFKTILFLLSSKYHLFSPYLSFDWTDLHSTDSVPFAVYSPAHHYTSLYFVLELASHSGHKFDLVACQLISCSTNHKAVQHLNTISRYIRAVSQYCEIPFTRCRISIFQSFFF